MVGISHRGFLLSHMSRPIGDVLRIRRLDWICLLHVFTLECVQPGHSHATK
jgi:hypothetical protein